MENDVKELHYKPCKVLNEEIRSTACTEPGTNAGPHTELLFRSVPALFRFSETL